MAFALAPASTQQTRRAWFENAPTPVRYEISVTPDIVGGTFTGESKITIESREPLASIAMNALDIEVTRALIDSQSAAFAVDNDAQTLTLTPRPLPAGRHTIRLETIVGASSTMRMASSLVEYDQDGQTRRARDAVSNRRRTPLIADLGPGEHAFGILDQRSADFWPSAISSASPPIWTASNLASSCGAGKLSARVMRCKRA